MARSSCRPIVVTVSGPSTLGYDELVSALAQLCFAFGLSSSLDTNDGFHGFPIVVWANRPLELDVSPEPGYPAPSRKRSCN